MKAISLFQLLKQATTKQAKATPEPKAPPIDTSYLKKFSHLSEELKKEIVKTATVMDVSRRDIYDIVSDLDKNQTIQKQAAYIKWYKQITAS